MASVHPEGPTSRKPAGQFSILDETPAGSTPWQVQNPSGVKRDITTAEREGPIPLTTSKMANQQSGLSSKSILTKKLEDRSSSTEQPFSINELLQHLNKDSQRDTSLTSTNNSKGPSSTSESLDEPLLEQDDTQVAKLKKELEAANSRIALMNQELAQTQITKHTVQHVLGSSSDSDELALNVTSEPPPVNPTIDLPFSHDPRDFGYDKSNALSPISYESYPDSQRENAKSGPMPYLNAPFGQSRISSANWDQPSWANPEGSYGFAGNRGQAAAPQPQRPFNFRVDNYPNNSHLMTMNSNSSYDGGYRRGLGQVSRPNSAIGHMFGNVNSSNSWASGPTTMSNAPAFSPPISPMPYQAMNNMQLGAPHYQPRPIGTPLSATALEFSGGGFPNNPWNVQPSPEEGSTYMPPMEPMNYRRLLDRNMSCNWKYIVDKIVCSNDQQASIFLQQKLKVSTPEQKFELIEAIIAQAYPLMINRFGNFLVQRCFEHGTPQQIIAIANAIRGNTLSLSMDAFGCHVVQKAFDVVPEDYKAIMVHELLRRIPETVIHRYACHVWQKLFELRWSDSPPQIMKYVNEALRGMWHEVALGETGSLVVQNIFENCLEEDKRPCINEVLHNIDIISHGQFGNWCIQHICEHGAPPDKSRAIEHVLHYATEYSIDQFASKVVEKCLKIAGLDFIDRYLERVCEGRQNRPRMPLIDIAGDQYGNYLVQHILIHAAPQHRELVANHVRKHMVSLRGSKFGSRVAMLCCNPAYATRPGPPMIMPMNNRFPSGNNNNNNNMGRGNIGGPY